MNDEQLLAKTNRINMLFDFYDQLLTEKQQTFLKCYFQDDFSLGEIAAEFGISRQAVYEHIKRAEQTLETYESKLQLLVKFEARTKLHAQLQNALSDIMYIPDPQRAELQMIVRELQALE
ncbi:putative DNA-binding protein [Paenibacillus sp. ACRRX]|uniref:putative DNA-binding protein n=1 Tax=unclassified Paenibacillus TaxID=185978 RepID=UPI001EF41DFC|nr:MULTISPECIES: putative DNA-binding protein [unclassified Paenibacillus]MCG7407528.1 putative DNA-binding protein [Paenibacillus sp. ACRRX]MDK8180763.1 putative DNA-binding protein [Paenibacillus sp. UMB4589-SE434]